MASPTKAAASDVEPGSKRRRLLDAGGPIEDDETARQKMRDAKVYKKGVASTSGDYDGFDPNDVSAVKGVNDHELSAGITAMGYFAMKGDLPMMRWLCVNGADTRDLDLGSWFPMFAAACEGQTEACKWLFDHGAAKDIKRRDVDTFPNGVLTGSMSFMSQVRGQSQILSRWLILNGALCKDDNSGKLDAEIMKQDLGAHPGVEEREALLEWATDLHRAHTSFLLFLSGALSSASQHAHHKPRSSSPVRLLIGKPGVLELICDYTGIVRGREARIIRQLTEMLPKVIAEFPVEPYAHYSSDDFSYSSGE